MHRLCIVSGFFYLLYRIMYFCFVMTMKRWNSPWIGVVAVYKRFDGITSLLAGFY